MAGIYTNTVWVRSSNVRAIGWACVDGEDILEVEFLNGSLYKYTGVAYWHYKEMLRASSKGGYLHRAIKRKRRRYPYKMLRTPGGRVLVPIPVVEPPVVEEPVVEPPVVEEPVVDPPVIDDPVIKYPPVVDPPEPEPVIEEPDEDEEPEPEDPWGGWQGGFV